MTISTEHIITSLTSLYGESVTTGDIRAGVQSTTWDILL